MTDALVPVSHAAPLARASEPGIFDLAPRQMVERATDMANVLADVIRRQRLYTTIQGKDHVRVDGWATLGTMLGILPREVKVVELADGSYEATVELYNFHTGRVVGQASALCGTEEKRWKAAERYARRSMAVTRATGKAYRLGFSWIMSLAGYEATPAEEMPDLAPPQAVAPPQAAERRETRVSHAARQPAEAPPPETFNKDDFAHVERLEQKLTTMTDIPAEAYIPIMEALHDKPMTQATLKAVIEDVMTSKAIQEAFAP